MQQILNTSVYITQALGYYNNRVQNTTVLAQAGRVPDLIGGNILEVSFLRFESRSVILNRFHAVQVNFFFQNDHYHIKSFKDELLDKSYKFETKVITSLNFLHRVSEGMVSIVDFQKMGSSSKTLNFMNYCSNERSMNISSILVNLSHVSDPTEQDKKGSNWTLKILYPDARYVVDRIQNDVGETGNCQQLNDELKSVSLYYTRYSPMYIIPLNMDKLLGEKFPYARYNYSSSSQYQECVALETELLPQIDEYVAQFEHVEGMLMNLTTSEIQESLASVETLLSYYDKIINIGLIYHEYHSKINDACNWIRPVISHQNSLLWKITGTYWSPAYVLQNVDTSLEKIRNSYMKLDQYYSTVIHPDIEILQSYLIGNITKMELGKKLRSMKDSSDVLYQLKEDLLTQITEYSTKMSLSKDSLVELYELYVTFDFPFINKENVYELELVEKAAAINDSRMQELVDNLKVDAVNYLPELMKECFNRLAKSMEMIRDDLVKHIEDVLGQLAELQKDLEIYQTSTIMDTDFFM